MPFPKHEPFVRRKRGRPRLERAVDRFALCHGCGNELPVNRAAGLCASCSKAQVQRWEREMAERSKRVPTLTAIAGYVPPKGSIAQQFFGRVIPPIKSYFG